MREKYTINLIEYQIATGGIHFEKVETCTSILDDEEQQSPKSSNAELDNYILHIEMDPSESFLVLVYF